MAIPITEVDKDAILPSVHEVRTTGLCPPIRTTRENVDNVETEADPQNVFKILSLEVT